jgi:SAM-dependent methyltransferase
VSVYGGDFANFYDLFHSDKPYDVEVEFLDLLLRENASGPSNRLLDLACGTGQHAVRLARRGWDVTGVDQSHEMLRKARDRSPGQNVQFLQQDMRDLELPITEFDAAVCLFDSIGYVVTNEAVAETLAGVRRHLRHGGLFVVEFWHAPPMLSSFDPVRVREWQTRDGVVLRTSRTKLDVVSQVARVEYDVYYLRSDGTYDRWTEVHENRFFLVQEMDLFLRSAGLEPLRWFAGYEADKQIDESTWHVLCLAQAVGGQQR